MSEKLAEQIAKAYFESEAVVSHYFKTSERIGLWNSEKRLFCRLFSESDQLLDLGCGTGRIALGLEREGFQRILAADYSAGMVENGRQIAESVESKVDFTKADARSLPWPGTFFDGVIFGFNGFFMIPGACDRFKALNEIYRVLKPGGRFIFTGHDRMQANQTEHWKDEWQKWRQGLRDIRKCDFGDIIEETDLGLMYIHSTLAGEVQSQLAEAGFTEVQTYWRSELANENILVRAFSDECRFWIATKPE